MPDLSDPLVPNRPKILVRAARLAQKRYNRRKMLQRWLLCSADLAPKAALADFREMESEMDAQRREGSFDYRVADHVELLAAVLHEAGLCQSTYPNASGSEALRVAI